MQNQKRKQPAAVVERGVSLGKPHRRGNRLLFGLTSASVSASALASASTTSAFHVWFNASSIVLIAILASWHFGQQVEYAIYTRVYKI